MIVIYETMKAEIKEGSLYVIAENYTESYALDCWHQTNIDGCSGQFKVDAPWRIFGIQTQIPKFNLFHRIWLRFRLFLYK
jgi:hypothetical protein